MSSLHQNDETVSTTEDDVKKQQHLQLSTYIKSVHAGLRKNFKQCGDGGRVWRDHCADTDTLSRYAIAMHRLATDHWTQRGDTRIAWCHRVCVDYFLSGGLQRLREKDERRRGHEASNNVLKMENSGEETSLDARREPISRMECAPPVPTPGGNVTFIVPEAMDCDVVEAAILPRSLLRQCCDPPRVDTDHLESCPSDVFAASLLTTRGSTSSLNVSEMSEVRTLDEGMRPCQEDDTRQSTDTVDGIDQLGELDEEVVHDDHAPVIYNVITLPFCEKIRLLDVGSCYNAFSQFKEFHSLAIDLSPAVPSVLSCDFLQLRLAPPLQLATDSLSTFVSGLRSPLASLSQSLFHCVVFSLFLGYLPDPAQRWRACVHASRLLVPDGLLLIVTPDSKAQHRNAGMIRGWRTALEALGFTRHRYEKQEHVHCMAFRLSARPVVLDDQQDGRPTAQHQQEDLAHLMSIPQDATDSSEEEDEVEGLEGEGSGLGDGDSISILQDFHELPGP